MNSLLVSFVLFTSVSSQASIQVKDLGLKLNHSNLEIEDFNPAVTQTVVGYCQGHRFTDYANLEGCERASQVTKTNLTPTHSATIGSISTPSITSAPVKVNIPSTSFNLR